MPKFKVTVCERVATVYADVEVEADTLDNAIIRAEAMALNGKLEEVGGGSNWSSDAIQIGG